MVARPWTKIKEEALAIAWVKSSTCPIVGNNQTDTSFWKATPNGVKLPSPEVIVQEAHRSLSNRHKRRPGI
ncbi:hypothetical protein HanIR_Chr17g0848941 [Helianthus annuus]|nr:hypothetical protein HanIR_Chr17g0848941 [Helianthus annuus]